MYLSRRELLTAFLGASFASAACGVVRRIESFPEGEIVGQNVELGHALREKKTVDVPPDNWQSVKVAIVGGGVAGLAAAWKFHNENFHDFVLLELEKEIGGTSRSGVGNPVAYPWGAH